MITLSDRLSRIENEIYDNEEYVIACDLILSVLQDNSVHWVVSDFIKIINFSKDCFPCKDGSGYSAATPHIINLANQLKVGYPKARSEIAESLLDWIENHVELIPDASVEDLKLLVSLYEELISRFPEEFSYGRWVSIYSGYSKRLHDLGLKEGSSTLLGLSVEAKKMQLQICQKYDLPSYWKRDFLIAETKIYLAELMLEIYRFDRNKFRMLFYEGEQLIGQCTLELHKFGTKMLQEHCLNLRTHFNSEHNDKGPSSIGEDDGFQAK